MRFLCPCSVCRASAARRSLLQVFFFSGALNTSGNMTRNCVPYFANGDRYLETNRTRHLLAQRIIHKVGSDARAKDGQRLRFLPRGCALPALHGKTFISIKPPELLVVHYIPSRASIMPMRDSLTGAAH